MGELSPFAGKEVLKGCGRTYGYQIGRKRDRNQQKRGGSNGCRHHRGRRNCPRIELCPAEEAVTHRMGQHTWCHGLCSV